MLNFSSLLLVLVLLFGEPIDASSSANRIHRTSVVSSRVGSVRKLIQEVGHELSELEGLIDREEGNQGIDNDDESILKQEEGNQTIENESILEQQQLQADKKYTSELEPASNFDSMYVSWPYGIQWPFGKNHEDNYATAFRQHEQITNHGTATNAQKQIATENLERKAAANSRGCFSRFCRSNKSLHRDLHADLANADVHRKLLPEITRRSY